MRIGYSCTARAVYHSLRRLVVGFGIFALPGSICFGAAASGATAATVTPTDLTSASAKAVAKPSDSRAIRLRNFLSRLHCPVKDLADEFIRVADENHLDWRLLPSISVIESGGGKMYRNNNIFGWNNGAHAFASIRSSIQEVAEKLSRGARYRNRDLVGKLHIYNPDSAYAASVMNVMDRISRS